MLKLYIPLFSFLTIVAKYLFGLAVIPNLVLGLFNQLFICLLLGHISPKYLPFSASQTLADKSGAFLSGILKLAIPTSIGVMHILLFNFKWVVYVLIILSVVATWVLFDSIKRISWARVESAY